MQIDRTIPPAPDAVNVQERLLYEMRSGCFKDCDRLPRESLLAEALSISRTQLRDSLAELEREGFISRRQGVGTLINRHVLRLPVRMDLEIEFMDMVKKSGKKAAEKLIKVGGVLSVAAAEKLGIGRTDEMLFVSRIVTADGKPVIYCEDYIPRALIKKPDYPREALEKPIFAFLSDYCGKDAYLDVTQIRPFASAGAISQRLNVPDGTPLLFMDEVDYDFDGVPVMYSRQFYVDGIITHNVVRRKI
ncbi:MAG: GntR family transcriptional regulator [Clostridia bacterium]|nr:GntR family transcriptional regulator [Clostridia bacterium]MBR6108786.1 GntR family transcriptional regulator [Clostridia bacterium]